MKKMPIGIQSFRKIVEGNYVYVDKTQYVYNLINGASYYFLSRPRRFGKSLLLDTIAEAFGGDRELFKGLFLYDSDHDFAKHPVLRLDMSNIANETPEILKNSLVTELRKRIEAEGLDITSAVASDIFKLLIEGLHDRYSQTVVVLIDEYDKPILDHITDADIAEANRAVLKGFYGILKSMDPHLRMTFITGVTKFTKTSIFSELNNLYDITLDVEYANICGIPTRELEEHFGEHIKSMSSLENFTQFDSLHDAILSWYDGYSWDGKTRVVNPFSLLNFFQRKKFLPFWYSSGTPTFLVKLLKAKPESFVKLRNLEISESVLDKFDICSMQPEPLLFQSGYLTVAETRHQGVYESYLLKIPNNEVNNAFNMDIVTAFAETSELAVESAYNRINESLEAGDLQAVLETLKSLFASIPYELHIKREAYYHSIFYAMLNLLGFDVQAEVSVSGGRIDATLELADKAYVIELKYVDCHEDASEEKRRELAGKALDEAMEQIAAKGYADKYAGSGKKVHLAAFAFLGRDDIEMRTAVL